MGVCTIGLKAWNKDGYGRREYVQREMYNLKLKWAIGKMKWYAVDIKNSCFSTILSVIIGRDKYISALALCISASLRHCRNEYLKSFFVLVMFLYMSPVLGLQQFTHCRKAAFAIWCFDLTTEFQPGMLNFPSFFLPVVLNAEDAAEGRALVSSAYKFSISSRCFSSVQLKFWQCLTSVGNCSRSSRFFLSW